MTPKERLKLINQKIQLLNDSVLINKKWKLSFENKGANNYCLMIVLNKKELFIGKFDTFGSVLSALLLIEFIFNKALNEKGKKMNIKSNKEK